MDMSGMDGMGGMDMSSTGLFVGVNRKIAHALWYIVVALVLVRGLRTLIDALRTRQAKRKHDNLRSAIPSRPTNIVSQAYETFLTICRETAYPTLQPFRGRILRYFSLPPLGNCLLLLTYWTVVLIMLWSNVILTPNSSLYGYKWEKPAFRAAWVSVTQVPLVYALSSKFNMISIVSGISYERLNWLHRWVSRTLFLTVIMHWAYFYHEWTLADFVNMELKMMPMVKYGFGAWGVLGWTVLSGFGLFRDLCYELWVLQHLASAGLLLWLLYCHVPSYARYNIWMAIGFVVFDRVARGIWSLLNNTHGLGIRGKMGLGFKCQVNALEHGYLKLSVKDVDFNWRAGQHVFLSIPSCGIFESHPFTIASTADETSINKDLDVYMKCHSGFTKRLQQRAQKSPDASYRIFLSGPWGTPPLANIERANSLIFIASSTGASFTVPLLEHAIRSAPFVQHLCFYWIVRHTDQTDWFRTRLQQAIQDLAPLGLETIQFRIYVTGLPDTILQKTISTSTSSCADSSASNPAASEKIVAAATDVDVKKSAIVTTDAVSKTSSQYDLDTSDTKEPQVNEKALSTTSSISPLTVETHYGRPLSFDPLIRPTVESSLGETFIISCGGKSLTAQIRSYVAQLSDERAVHKGTGAQSIGLFTESYGW